MSALVPCPACGRHVKAEEAACPFCQAAVPSARCSGRCAATLPERLQQAALLAAGAALLGAACGSGPTVYPPYGIPPHVDAGAQPRADAGAGDAPRDGGDAEK